jgi:hypothetical protein
MKPILAFLAVLIVFFLVHFTVQANTKVEFVNPPHYLTDDSVIVLQVRVEPRPENRLLIVAAVDGSGEVVRASDEELSGEAAPRTRWIEWKNGVPEDTVLIRAVVFNSEAKILGADTIGVTVFSKAPQAEPQADPSPNLPRTLRVFNESPS